MYPPPNCSGNNVFGCIFMFLMYRRDSMKSLLINKYFLDMCMCTSRRRVETECEEDDECEKYLFGSRKLVVEEYSGLCSRLCFLSSPSWPWLLIGTTKKRIQLMAKWPGWRRSTQWNTEKFSPTFFPFFYRPLESYSQLWILAPKMDMLKCKVTICAQIKLF